MISLPLTRGLETWIDDEDSDRLAEFRYSAIPCMGKFYAASTRLKRIYGSVLLHRAIINAPKGMCVDHINGNTLDNRRSNLRLATHKQNMQNRKKHNCKNPYKGVYEKRSGRYTAMIFDNSKLKNLGVFETAEEAAKVYDARAAILHGEFARLNFPVVPSLFFLPISQTQITENTL
jgi:HNH endonuclease